MPIIIDTMQPGDWESIRSLYLEALPSGDATFETTAPDWEAWNRSRLPFARLVARSAGSIIGWTALSPVSGRFLYAGVAEVSLYVAASARGKGLGRALLNRLIEESERHGVWSLQATILRENRVSIALHGLCGFREVGVLERVGKFNRQWRDLVLLERRSSIVGID